MKNVKKIVIQAQAAAIDSVNNPGQITQRIGQFIDEQAGNGKSDRFKIRPKIVAIQQLPIRFHIPQHIRDQTSLVQPFNDSHRTGLYPSRAIQPVKDADLHGCFP
jgi:hypothetical protein